MPTTDTTVTRNDGGAAFPSPTANPVQDGQLSVRDYFAGQALQLIAREGLGPEYSASSVFDVARAAYAIADAMLAERAK